MDPLRHNEDSHTRHGFGPKLTVTGWLEGTLFGRPVQLEASGRDLVLQIANLRSAWRLRRTAAGGILPLLRSLHEYGISLRVRIGTRLTLEVLPRPSLGLRLIVPALNLVTSGENP